MLRAISIAAVLEAQVCSTVSRELPKPTPGRSRPATPVPQPAGPAPQAELAHEAEIERLRLEHAARKIRNQRRRLPKGHPDRLE